MGEENSFGQVGVWFVGDEAPENEVTFGEDPVDISEDIPNAATEEAVKADTADTVTDLIPVENADVEVSEKGDDEEGMSTDTAAVDMSVPKENDKRRMPLFFGVLRVILVICGVFAYLIPAILFTGRMTKGGFFEFALWRVFGGVEETVVVAPLEPETDAPMTETAPTVDENGIVAVDLSCNTPFEVFNETGYNIDDETVSAMVNEAVIGDGAVLIIHTHGTEAYYDSGDGFRSEDTRENVVAVGDEFARALENAGIKVYHCREMFDRDSYIDSYKRSGEAVMGYLREHPDISYVIDIHRDAVIKENGDVVRSDGGNGAQVMIVCGSDEKGADFPRWRENLSFGAKYQSALFGAKENFVRPINLRGASFNEQLSERYLLLEVGTCGNTLEEALESANTAATVLSHIILEGLKSDDTMDNGSQKS